MEHRIDRIRSRLERFLKPTQLRITDDSHRHVGHAGARDGRGHFSVAIESLEFANKSQVARHRMVYSALGDLMLTDIHAVSIRARCPGEP